MITALFHSANARMSKLINIFNRFFNISPNAYFNFAGKMRLHNREILSF